MAPTAYSFLVAPEQEGERLDLFLRERLPGASRAAVRRLLAGGSVAVDGRRWPKGGALLPGQKVEVERYVAPGAWGPEPEPDLEIRVIHEEPELVAVDKPPHVPCHPLRPGERGTVAGALVARFPELADASPDRREAGLVHRLDTGTSGVLLFARSREAHRGLVSQVRGGGATKRYLALVEGDPSGRRVVEVALTTRGPRAVPVEEGRPSRGRPPGRPARTELEVVERLGPFALVRATLASGRRHQVRAHLAHAGHPIAGDRLYGGRHDLGLDRPFLHAAEVRLTRPAGDGPIEIRAPLAADLEACLAALRGGAE